MSIIDYGTNVKLTYDSKGRLGFISSITLFYW